MFYSQNERDCDPYRRLLTSEHIPTDPSIPWCPLFRSDPFQHLTKITLETPDFRPYTRTGSSFGPQLIPYFFLVVDWKFLRVGVTLRAVLTSHGFSSSPSILIVSPGNILSKTNFSKINYPETLGDRLVLTTSGN